MLPPLPHHARDALPARAMRAPARGQGPPLVWSRMRERQGDRLLRRSIGRPPLAPVQLENSRSLQCEQGLGHLQSTEREQPTVVGRKRKRLPCLTFRGQGCGAVRRTPKNARNIAGGRVNSLL